MLLPFSRVPFWAPIFDPHTWEPMIRVRHEFHPPLFVSSNPDRFLLGFLTAGFFSPETRSRGCTKNTKTHPPQLPNLDLQGSCTQEHCGHLEMVAELDSRILLLTGDV